MKYLWPAIALVVLVGVCGAAGSAARIGRWDVAAWLLPFGSAWVVLIAATDNTKKK